MMLFRAPKFRAHGDAKAATKTPVRRTESLPEFGIRSCRRASIAVMKAAAEGGEGTGTPRSPSCGEAKIDDKSFGISHARERGGRRIVSTSVASAMAMALWQAWSPGKEGQQATALGFKKDLSQRKKRTSVPEESFVPVDGVPGLKKYDFSLGTGAAAKPGDRIAVHFDVKYRNLTVATSRQGMGVTGGTPYGFQIGLKPGEAGSTFIKGMDLGVQGMKVGGFRRLLVPPNLAYGNKQVQEIPPNATLTIDLELLSIKTSPLLGLNG